MCIEQLHQFEFAAIHPPSPLAVRARWRRLLERDDIFLGACEDMQGAFRGGRYGKDRSNGKEGVQHKKDRHPPSQTDLGGDIHQARGARVLGIVGMDFSP